VLLFCTSLGTVGVALVPPRLLGICCTEAWWFIFRHHQDLAKDGALVVGGGRGSEPSGTRQHPETWELTWYEGYAPDQSSYVAGRRGGYVVHPYGRCTVRRADRGVRGARA
jgi:hypothetical protein